MKYENENTDYIGENDENKYQDEDLVAKEEINKYELAYLEE